MHEQQPTTITAMNGAVLPRPALILSNTRRGLVVQVAVVQLVRGHARTSGQWSGRGEGGGRWRGGRGDAGDHGTAVVGCREVVAHRGQGRERRASVATDTPAISVSSAPLAWQGPGKDTPCVLI